MARLARAAVAGVTHHVTRRGDRRRPVFFGDEDDRAWRAPLAEGRAAAGAAVWAIA